jgi:hypothetical protein
MTLNAQYKNYDIQIDITNHSDHVTNITRIATTNVSIKIISIIDTQPPMFKTPLKKTFGVVENISCNTSFQFFCLIVSIHYLNILMTCKNWHVSKLIDFYFFNFN